MRSICIAANALTEFTPSDSLIAQKIRVVTRMKATVPPKLRAEFKEVARYIIAADRHARRSGRSQNTIGEIERALVRTYLLGRAHNEIPPGGTKSTANEAIEWILIPPRARDTLWSMTCAQDRIPGRAPDQLLRYADGPKIRWRFIRPSGLSDDHSVADGSVRPLIKLGLLAAREEESDLFELTQSGLATTQEYWRRSNANDPGLPVISMR